MPSNFLSKWQENQMDCFEMAGISTCFVIMVTITIHDTALEPRLHR